ATELTASLDFRLDRKLIAPGEPLQALLVPLFDPGTALSGEYTVRLTLKQTAGKALAKPEVVTVKEFKERKVALPTRDLKPGRYAVEYELSSPDGKALVSCSRDFLVHADAGRRAAELRKQVEKLKADKVAGRGVREAAALETAEYVGDILTRAGKEYV